MNDANFEAPMLPVAGFNPVDVIGVLAKRRILLLALGLAGAVAAFGASYAVTPQYQAEGTLVVRSQAMTADESERAFDSTVVNEAVVTTETQILTSAGLLNRVAAIVPLPPELLQQPDRLYWVRLTVQRLAAAATFIPEPWRLMAIDAVAPATPLTQAALKDQRERFIAGATTVVPTKGSSVIIVRANTSNATASAAIVNELLDFYMQERSGEQSAAAATIEAALRERLRQVEARATEGEDKLVRMLEQPGAVENSDIPGTMRDLSLLGPQIVQADADVARRTAEYNAVLRPSGKTAGLGLPTPEALALQRQLTDLQQQMARMSTTMGSEFPAHRALQNQITTLKAELASETQYGIEQRRVALVTAQSTASSLRQQLALMRQSRVSQSSATIGLGRQRETIASLSRISDALQTRLIDLAARVSNPNARILGVATPPLRAAFPNKQLFAVSGFILAVLASAGVLLAREHMRKLRPMAIQLARQVNAPLLGIVPRFLTSRHRALPDMNIGATVNGLGLPETLQALALELEDVSRQQNYRSFMVTSAYAGEGKTTVTVLLGRHLALTGMRVLLVDLDLRYPSIAKTLSEPGRGLNETGLRFGPYPLLQAQIGKRGSLHVVTPFPDGSTELDMLLRSGVFQSTLSTIQTGYDIVLIDTGPIMAVPDAIKIADLCDAIVLTAELGRSSAVIMAEVLRRLGLTRKPICGVIVTKVEPKDRQAGLYTGYASSRSPAGRALARQDAV